MFYRKINLYAVCFLSCFSGYCSGQDLGKCKDLLEFGREIFVKKDNYLALYYNKEIGISERLKQLGGTAKVIIEGVPLAGSFNAKASEAKYQQSEEFNLKKHDQFIFTNRLGKDVAKAWLDCMKFRHGATKPFGWINEEEKQIYLRYGNIETLPAKVLKYQLSTGLELKQEFPKSILNEVKISVNRKDKTQTEAIKVFVETAVTKTKHEIVVVWGPEVPNVIHFQEEVSVSVPEGRAKPINFSIPAIPKNVEATLVGIYQGGSPADRAKWNLTCDVILKDENGKDVPNSTFSWRQGAPNTHISPSKQSVAIKSGQKYQVGGSTVVERNGAWRGGSLVRVMVVVKLDPKKFDFEWLDPIKVN